MPLASTVPVSTSYYGKLNDNIGDDKDNVKHVYILT